MSGFLLRTMINALLVYCMVSRLPGIFVDTLGSMLLAALVLGVANGLVGTCLFRSSLVWRWPRLLLVTFLLNVLVMSMVVYIVPGFEISRLLLVVFEIFILSLCSSLLSKAIRDKRFMTGRVEPAKKGW